jgi:peptidyl-dipeptidase Dcp
MTLSETPEPPAPPSSPRPPAIAPLDPLLAPWRGAHGGVPPFDEVRVEHFLPAFAAAMAENLAEIEAIASDPAPPAFDNTLAALERCGRALDRVEAVFGVFAGTMSTPEVQAVEREIAPLRSAHADRIFQNAALFRRLAIIYEGREEAGLTAEQQRLAWLHYTSFVRAGAALDDAAKERLAGLNQRLAALYTQFSQNVLADETDDFLVLAGEADLDGLPDSIRAGAAAAAAAKGVAGAGVILNTRSSADPFLTFSARRDLREKVWRTFVARGDKGGATDNKAIVSEILLLRGERAKLLGYPTHAHWRLEHAMAHDPERALELLETLWPKAVARVREEVADMQRVADREAAATKCPRIAIEPWDYRFYAEKVRKLRYDLDADEVKPYLELERLREGMFYVARRLFDLDFLPLPESGLEAVPVVRPDVRVWRVNAASSGREVGLFYFDPYARTGKRSGAWMNAYRSQESFDGEVLTLVSNNSNFVEGRSGEPVLVSWDDARTLFHEFGHALHGLSSRVSYPSLAGTAVSRDYVEFPSQLLEHWLGTPEVLERFARHVATGEPMPAELAAKIERAATFNQGFATVEYLASALVDMKLHLAAGQGGVAIDPDRFERETLAAIGMPKEIAMRHRTPQFNHIFFGDSYSAAYYSYLWADTLTADAWEAFTEAGGPWDESVAAKLVAHVFSAGNTVDPAEAYRAFRGRDPEIAALLRDRGFE